MWSTCRCRPYFMYIMADLLQVGGKYTWWHSCYRATHVIDTPVQTMYIMADLTSSGGKYAWWHSCYRAMWSTHRYRPCISWLIVLQVGGKYMWWHCCYRAMWSTMTPEQTLFIMADLTSSWGKYTWWHSYYRAMWSTHRYGPCIISWLILFRGSKRGSTVV